MHDPHTLAFRIKIPLPWKRKRGIRLKGEPKTEWAFYELANIWHVDPCCGPGGDDSCGWFMRAHHGDPQVLKRIEERFECDWDRTFESENTGNTYFCGLFCPNGDPHHSVHAIAINLFFIAAIEVLKSGGETNWKRAKKFMERNFFDILLFAENPTDSMFDTITRKWDSRPQTEESRKERIRAMAAMIYGWILRAEQPWYKHPRWHIHHWEIQIHFLRKLRRMLQKCATCHRHFRFNECVVSDHKGSHCGRCYGTAEATPITST